MKKIHVATQWDFNRKTFLCFNLVKSVFLKQGAGLGCDGLKYIFVLQILIYAQRFHMTVLH